MRTDPETLNYILTVFPPEILHLKLLTVILRERNLAGRKPPVDVEPVLVAALWMQRVLLQAYEGKLDVKGIFELSFCLAHELPKIMAELKAELREETCWGSPAELKFREFGDAR